MSTRTPIAAIDAAAADLLPPNAPDSSGIGVNYVDAAIAPLNAELADGREVTCKRKGLKITLTIGESSGESLLNRLEHGPDPREMLRHALDEAARQAGATSLSIEAGYFLLETT